MSEPLPSLSFYTGADQYADVPGSAYDARVQAGMDDLMSKGYYVDSIGGGVHYVKDGWYYQLVVEHDDGLIVVDAPPSNGQYFLGGNILEAMGSISPKPITHVIYSHHHRDHIGAASVFASDVTIIAQEECAALVASADDPQRPPATETFKDSYTLSVGGQTLQLDYHGDIHCNGNIFIYHPAEKVLMNIDVIFPGWVPFSSLAMASDLRGFMRGHDVVLGYDFDTFVPGHLTRLGNREDVEVQKEYFQDLIDTTMKHLDDVSPARNDMEAKVTFMSAAERAGGWTNPWLIFDTYLNGVTDEVVEEVLPRWTDRLAGADVFTRSHAWEVVERIRIDA